MQTFKWPEVILSIWILIHLSAVLIAPNRDSLWVTPAERGKVPYYDDTPAWIDAYLAPLGLLSTWSFFAPEPGPSPMFLDWEAEDTKGTVTFKGTFPDLNESRLFAESRSRLMAAAYFMIGADDRAERMLVPYLCKKLGPKAERIRLYRRIQKIPSITEVLEGKATEYNPDDFERNWISTTFCERDPFI